LGKPDKLVKVNSSGAVLRGNIGPLEVDPETHLPKKRIIP
jgi:hypothetical protein